MNKQQTYLINGGYERGVAPFDRGLSYGDGVFRTFKAVAGVPLDWPLHYQKLVADCGAIGIVCPSAEVLMGDIQHLFQIDETAVAKIIITRGEGERGYAPPAVTMPTRIVIRTIMPEYLEAHFDEGVALYSCKTVLAYQPLLAGVKHLNRLENVLARAEWSDPHYVDGLMFDAEGNVIACTSANVFARFGQKLCTPRLNRCGVAGVTRQKVLNLASGLGLIASIKDIQLNELLTSDEVIITNSLYGAWQVRSFASAHWRKGQLANDMRALLLA